MIELFVEILFEVLLEAGFEGIGWVLRRRWGRRIVGLVLGIGAGVGWSVLIEDRAPVVASVVIAAQAAAIPFFAGREFRGRTLDRATLVDLVLIGAAVVAGRWLGFGL